MAEFANPLYSVTVEGKKYRLQFDVNDNPSKKGIKMQFILDQEFQDPRDKQALSNKISIALQKRFSEANIAIDMDERNPYKNVIGFIVPLSSISEILINVLKGNK